MPSLSAVAMHVFGGGMLHGFAQAKGVEVLADLETFTFGQRTVKRNHPRVEMVDWNDLHARSGAQQYQGCDVLFGNPRCTGFSSFNANMGEGLHGPDAQQTLDIQQMVALAEEIRPRFLVMESVQQFITVGKALLERIASQLSGRYRCAVLLHSALTFCVPQVRKRLFVVFYPRGESFYVPPPAIPEVATTVRHVIGDLACMPEPKIVSRLDDAVPESLGYSRPVPFNWYRYDDPRWVKVYPAIPPGGTIQSAPIEQLPPSFRRKRLMGVHPSLHTACRLCWDRPGHVVYAKNKYLHPELDRTLAVREAARLMGVDDGYGYLGQHLYAQVGNGVCPPIARWLAEALVQNEQREKEYDGEHEADSVGQLIRIFQFTKRHPSYERRREHLARIGIPRYGSAGRWDWY